jgi:hypothetical protein
MQSSFTTKQIQRRFDQVLSSFKPGAIRTDSDAIRELADLALALEDEPVKPTVLARLTIHRANGIRMIIEVSSDATFSTFYRFFTQQGARRSTKRFLRNGSRNEGIPRLGYYLPGLESVAATIEKYADPNNPIVKKSIRIIQRKAYRKLIGMRPDLLGLTKMSPLPIYSPVTMRHS